MTPGELERLAILSEEMAEAQQIIGKILRFGYEAYHPKSQSMDTNRYLLATELGHVQNAISMLCGGDIDQNQVDISRARKAIEIREYLRHQKEGSGD